MEYTYAGQIENGVVVQIIVGTAEWAEANIGGKWVNSPTKIGVGMGWNETEGFYSLEQNSEEPFE